MTKRIRASFLYLFLLLGVALAEGALAETPAEDITAQCEFAGSSKNGAGRLYDRDYTTFWKSGEERGASLEITLPEGREAAYLYICFADLPKSWAIEAQAEGADGAWRTLYEGGQAYHHVVVELGGKGRLRLIDTSGKKAALKLNEIFVFTAGRLPDWVQRWQPAPEKADLLVLAAHPDDEILFFGGAIPTYAAERGKDVVVAYMTYSNTTRRSELLNALWHMGVRQYPVIGTFYDTYTRELEDAYARWRKTDTRAFVMELIRRYTPDVVLTHDVNGEYGHGAHKLCADAARYCVERAGDAAVLPELAERFGVWEVKKLYLHLYGENTVEMDWRKPLAAFGGRTGLEVAQEAYRMHVTQQRTEFEVTDEGRTSCARFGLAYSRVGPDEEKDDFFEHIEDCESGIGGETG